MKACLKDLCTTFRSDIAKAHKSLTIWFNALAGAALAALPFAQEQLPQLQDYLPGNFYHDLMGAVVAGNILLRFKTRSALADKP
jgi:hypothetical protein